MLTQAHKRLGYTAAFCPDAKPGDTARVNAIPKAFADAGVLIAEAGAWRNIITPDPVARKANIEYVTSRLALADELGVKCCVDIARSFDANTLSGPYPKNLSKDFFGGTVNAAKPRIAKFAIEMKAWDLPDGPDSHLKLIRAIDRNTFGVHIDICNIVNSPALYYNNTALIRDTFQKLGRWVLSCHAKYFEVGHSGQPEFRGASSGARRHSQATEQRSGVPRLSRRNRGNRLSPHARTLHHK